MTKNKKLTICLIVLAFCLCCVVFAICNSSKKSIVASADTRTYAVASASTAEANLASDEVEKTQAIKYKADNDAAVATNDLSVDEYDSDYSEISSVADESIILDLYLKWVDDYGVQHPLRGIYVSVYSRWDGTKTGYTDDSGYLSFEFPFVNDAKVYIYVYAESRSVTVEYSNGIKYSYVFEKSLSAGHNTTEDLIYMDSDLGKAFQMSQAVIAARDFAEAMMGKLPSPVTVRYVDLGEKINCSYNSESKTIIINKRSGENGNPDSYACWDVIMHEYGHHIQYEVGIIDYPKNVENHIASHNDADDLNNKDDGVKLAWAESWPTVFGMIAQKYCIEKGLLDDNIKTVGDSYYTAYNNLNYDINIRRVGAGEACEDSIMGVLWDLFDDDIEENDTIALGYQAFWDVTTKNQSKTFSDFMKVFYDTYPELTDAIGANLSYYLMAYAKFSVSDYSLEELPTLYWTHGSGSKYFYYTDFILNVYDSDENLLFSVPDILSPKYTLDENQWNQILSTRGSYYLVSVAYINGNGSIVTGPYISPKLQVYKPIDLWQIGIDKPLKVMIDLQECIWFKFVAPTAGNYTFYSEGYSDTSVELYSQLYDYKRYYLGSDDNSGTNKNYKISYNLKYKEVIFLKINIIYDFEYFVYNVTLNYQSNQYTDPYRYCDEQYHMRTCEAVDKPFECLVLDTKDFDLVDWQSKQIY